MFVGKQHFVKSFFVIKTVTLLNSNFLTVSICHLVLKQSSIQGFFFIFFFPACGCCHRDWCRDNRPGALFGTGTANRGVSKTRGRGRGRGRGQLFIIFFFVIFMFSFCFLCCVFFFMILPNANNQRLRRNRELHAEHHGVVFNHFSR